MLRTRRRSRNEEALKGDGRLSNEGDSQRGVGLQEVKL